MAVNLQQRAGTKSTVLGTPPAAPAAPREVHDATWARNLLAQDIESAFGRPLTEQEKALIPVTDFLNDIGHSGNTVQGEVARRRPGLVKYMQEQILTRQGMELAGTQQQLAQQQLQFNEQQMAEQRAFNDFLLGEEGYKRNPDTGAIEPIPESAAYQYKQAVQDRLLAAIKGELPVDPRLERNILEEEGRLRTQLERNQGSGYEQSTTGSYALANLAQRAEELRYGVRHGELTSTAALDAASKGQLAGVSGRQVGADYQAGLGLGSGLYQNAAATGGATLAQLAEERRFQQSLQAQRDAARSALRGQLYGGIGQLAGQGAGLAAMYAMAGCCPPDLLIDTPMGPTPIADLVVGDEVYTWDSAHRRVVAPIRQVAVMPVAESHVMVTVLFDDGQAVELSPIHPMADGRQIQAFAVGDRYGERLVASRQQDPYGYDRTHDILPAGATGVYFVQGVPVGSTLYLNTQYAREGIHG